MGVTVRTLRRYTDQGKLPDVRGAGSRRIFPVRDLDALTSRTTPVSVVFYGRVSSRRQQAEGDLDRQMERLRTYAGQSPVAGEFTDVASGLSDRRAGLRKALTACQDPAVSQLMVTHPERLARFGVGVIEHLLAGFGVADTCVGEPATADVLAESELVRDMLAIVTSFACRLYGQRSAATKRLRAAVAAEARTDHTLDNDEDCPEPGDRG